MSKERAGSIYQRHRHIFDGLSYDISDAARLSDAVVRNTWIELA